MWRKVTSLGLVFSQRWTCGSKASQWWQPYQKYSRTSLFVVALALGRCL